MKEILTFVKLTKESKQLQQSMHESTMKGRMNGVTMAILSQWQYIKGEQQDA